MNALDHLVRGWEWLSAFIEDHWGRSEGVRRWLCRQWGRTRHRPLAWGSLYAWMVIALGYGIVDRPLAFWLKAHVGGDAEGFWKTVTSLGLGAFWLWPSGLVLLGLLLAWRAAPTPELRARLARIAWVPGFFFLSVAGSGLINTAIKILVGRTRPAMLFEQGVSSFAPLTHAYATNSFPSGHSQTIFAAMTALALMLPRYDLAFLAVAALVAVSRVATTVHFLSDVAMGAWLGTVVTVLIYRALRHRGISVRISCERDGNSAQ